MFGWVACLIAFFSVCFSSLWKNVFLSSSTTSRSIEKLSVYSIVVRSIEVGFCLIAAWHLLDLSRSSCMHYFSHVLHISFILSSIASLFITFMHLYRFLMPPWSSLIIFMFLEWSFLTSCALCQSWQKMGEIVENMWFLFKTLHVRGRNTCICKGEMCFILLGVLTSIFLYIGLVTT